MPYDPIITSFLKSIEGGKPIYTMTPEEAREVLNGVQKGGDKPSVFSEDKEINGKNGKVSIRIVRPENHHKTLPVILYVHGGGWILGNKNTHDRLVREIAIGSHATVVFVNYTSSPEAKFPQPLDECYSALEYIHDHGHDINVDPNKIIVMGDSAGGDMAAALAIMAKEKKGPKLLYQVLLYPVTDAGMNTKSYSEFAEGPWLTKKAMEWFWNAYEPNVGNRKNKLVSPLQASIADLKGLPPTLIITDDDVLRDEGEAYAKKLLEANVPVTAVRFQNTIHDFMMLKPIAESPVTRSAIALVNATVHHAFYPDMVQV